MTINFHSPTPIGSRLAMLGKAVVFVASGVCLLMPTPLRAQTTLYWDINGATAESSGNTLAAGIWDQSTNNLWSTNSGGTVATILWSATAGDKIAVFSAGTNATGAFAVTVNGTVNNVAGITFEEGAVTLGGAGTLTLTGTPSINVATSSATISTSLAGTVGFSKTGAGTLALSGANTYTGATNINAGILSIQSAGALGTAANTANTTVASGATLQLANGVTTTNGGTLVLNGAGAGSGALQGVGGNNTWESAMALGSDATIFSATAGNILYLNSNYVSAHTLTLGNHTLTIDGPGDVWANANVGVAGDTGGLIKNGTGQLTLFGYNTFYTGATVVNAGSLELVVGAFTPGWHGINGPLTIGAGSANPALAGTVKVDIWGAGHSGGSSYADQIGPSSAVTINSDGILNVGVSTGLGSLTLNGGQVNISSGQAITPGGAITSNANSAHQTSLISGGTLTLAGSTTFNVARDATIASDLTVSSVVGGGALVKQGTGVLTLSGANTYTGATTVSAGVLNIQNNTALGTAAGATTVASGAALQVQSGITVTGEALTLNGTGIAADGALRNVSGNNTWTGAITLGSASRINSDAGTLAISGNIGGNTQNLTVGGAGNTTISSVIGTTTGALTKDGAGTLTLSGNNTYTGTTNINAGTLKLGANNALANTTAVTVASGATLNLNNYNDAIGSLAGSGTVALGSKTLTVGTDNTNTTFAGAFASGDTGTFAKTGTGILTFGSGMDLSAGTLQLGGGTLDLGGFSSTFKALSVTANSVLDFGTSGSSILNILNGSVTVSLGVILTIQNWTDTVDYFYSLVSPGATNLGRINFTVSPVSGARWQAFDNQIVPVPETSTYGAAFMLLGLSLGAWRCWRRRGKASTP
jgi:fibronectin-binding autotransporter adhesin